MRLIAERFITWLTDKMFDEKINTAICITGLVLAGIYIATIIVIAIIKGVF